MGDDTMINDNTSMINDTFHITYARSALSPIRKIDIKMPKYCFVTTITYNAIIIIIDTIVDTNISNYIITPYFRTTF